MASMPGGINKKERQRLKSSNPTSRRARKRAEQERKQARRAQQATRATNPNGNPVPQSNGQSRRAYVPSATAAFSRTAAPRIREPRARLTEAEPSQNGRGTISKNGSEGTNYTQRQIEALNHRMQERGFDSGPVGLGTRITIREKNRQVIRRKRNKQTKKATDGIEIVGAGKVQSLFLIRPTNSWQNTNEVSRRGYTERFLRIIGEYAKATLHGTRENPTSPERREAFTRAVLNSIQRNAQSRAQVEQNQTQRNGLIHLAEFAERITHEYNTRVEQSKRELAERRAQFGNRRRRANPESSTRESEEHTEPHREPESEWSKERRKFETVTERVPVGNGQFLDVTGPRPSRSKTVIDFRPKMPERPHSSLEARINAGEPNPYDHGKVKKVSITERADMADARREWQRKHPIKSRWKALGPNEINAIIEREQSEAMAPKRPNAFMRWWHTAKSKIQSRRRRRVA